MTDNEELEHGTIRGLPPMPVPQETDDPHADFHQRSMLPMGSVLCARCASGDEGA